MPGRIKPKSPTAPFTLTIVSAIIIGSLLLSGCNPRPHLQWTCEERYKICMEQCQANNDYLYEKISNLAVIEQELINCQQECALKYQYCAQAGCVSCR